MESPSYVITHLLRSEHHKGQGAVHALGVSELSGVQVGRFSPETPLSGPLKQARNGHRLQLDAVRDYFQ